MIRKMQTIQSEDEIVRLLKATFFISNELKGPDSLGSKDKYSIKQAEENIKESIIHRYKETISFLNGYDAREISDLLAQYKKRKSSCRVPIAPTNLVKSEEPSYLPDLQRNIGQDDQGTYFSVPREADLMYMKGKYEDIDMHNVFSYNDAASISFIETEKIEMDEEMGVDEEMEKLEIDQEYAGEEELMDEEDIFYDDYLKEIDITEEPQEISELSYVLLKERERRQKIIKMNELKIKILKNGASCPALFHHSKTCFDSKEFLGSSIKKPLVFESAFLDYALIMNMSEGNWGIDEDSLITQIFFKFIYDDSFRFRVEQKECHRFLDECDCPAHGKVANEKVHRLQKEFRHNYQDETNFEMERIINPGPDSDEETDTYYKEEIKIVEEVEPEIVDFDLPIEWLALKKEKYGAEPQFIDRPHSEEEIVMRIGHSEPAKPQVQKLKITNMVSKNEMKNIGTVVENLYNEKVEEQRQMNNKNINWRAAKIYAYKKPDWDAADIIQTENL